MYQRHQKLIDYDAKGVLVRHPTWTEEDYKKFLERCRPIVEVGVAYSSIIENHYIQVPIPKLKWNTKRASRYWCIAPQEVYNIIEELKVCRLKPYKSRIARVLGIGITKLNAYGKIFSINFPTAQPNRINPKKRAEYIPPTAFHIGPQ